MARILAKKNRGALLSEAAVVESLPVRRQILAHDPVGQNQAGIYVWGDKSAGYRRGVAAPSICVAIRGNLAIDAI